MSTMQRMRRYWKDWDYPTYVAALSVLTFLHERGSRKDHETADGKEMKRITSQIRKYESAIMDRIGYRLFSRPRINRCNRVM